MRRDFLFSLLLAWLITVPAATQAGDVVDRVARETAHKVFSEAERRIIHDYYGDSGHGDQKGKDKGKGPGKNGKLPPGLKMQLEKNGQLPPGIQKKSLPTGLKSRLPSVPKGYERVIVDSDVLLVHTASQIIADIITDVVLDH